jgi:prophage regulatory protein
VRHKCRKLGLRREAARHAGYLITAEQLPLLARQRSKRKQQGHPMTDDVTTMMMTTTTTTNNTDVPARSDGLLLTSAEVARQLAICTRTLWRLVEDGQFPQPIRLGRKLVRWRRKDVDAWVASLGQTKDVVEDAA